MEACIIYFIYCDGLQELGGFTHAKVNLRNRVLEDKQPTRTPGHVLKQCGTVPGKVSSRTTSAFTEFDLLTFGANSLHMALRLLQESFITQQRVFISKLLPLSGKPHCCPDTSRFQIPTFSPNLTHYSPKFYKNEVQRCFRFAKLIRTELQHTPITLQTA